MELYTGLISGYCGFIYMVGCLVMAPQTGHQIYALTDMQKEVRVSGS